MTTPDLRKTERLRGFVQGEDPDPLPVTFTTTGGRTVDDLTGWTPAARFRRPNGTTIDVDPGTITLTGGVAQVPFPPLDETGVWYADAQVTSTDDPAVIYTSVLHVFDVGDPLIATPGDPPPPGDTFVTETALEALEGTLGGLLPDGPANNGDVPTAQGGIVVWAPQSGGGPGGGQVNTVGAGHGIDVSGTASDPVVNVDESELDIALLGGTMLDSQVPATITRDTELAAEAAARSAADLLSIPLTQRGAPSGVPTLDGGGKIPSSQLPSIAVTDTFVVADQAAMLAVMGADVGDIAVRTDGAGTFILTATPASTLGNWQLLRAPTDAVTSIEGRTGAVSVADLYDPLGAAAAAQAFAIQRANQTGTQAIATVTGLQTALDSKAADSSVVHVTGAETVAGVKNFTSTPLVPGASLAADQAAATASPRTLGTGAAQAAAGNDGRLSDARTPTAHAASHAAAGTDPVTLTQAQITGLTAALALLAPVANPALTGNPTAPTPTAGDSDTSIATTAFVQQAIADGVTGLLDYRGTYDASVNTFPASGGSGAAGAVLKGDFWIVSVAGTLGSKAVTAGDLVIAKQDTPAQTAANWSLVEHDLGYAPEDSANKSNDATMAADSATLYPTQHATKAALALKADTAALGTAAAANTGTSAGNVPLVSQADLRYAFLELLTTVKTAAYTAADGEFVRLDTTGGTTANALPTAPRDGWTATYKWDAGTAAPTLTTGGSDTFKGGGTTLTFSALTQAVEVTYRLAEHIFVVKNSFSKTGLLALLKALPIYVPITSSATPTITVGADGADVHVTITALAAAITSMTTNLSGTPTDFQKMIVRIKDDSTARAITWGASFASKGATLPTTTVAGKLLTVGLLYNTATSLWGCVSVASEA